jgi:hypothetical protein
MKGVLGKLSMGRDRAALHPITFCVTGAMINVKALSPMELI